MTLLPRGALRTELLTALRQARKTRRPRTRGTDRRGQIPNMTPIAARPAEVVTRTVPGHWEGDLLKGARNGSAVGTLVERTTRLVILARMEGTDATSARRGFTKKLRHVPALLRKTLTYDRGKEMAEHERLAQRLAIQLFFADPHSPWQRGGIENANGLLRRDMPRKTRLSDYTDDDVEDVIWNLNSTPRKCLGYRTPIEAFAAVLLQVNASAGDSRFSATIKASRALAHYVLDYRPAPGTGENQLRVSVTSGDAQAPRAEAAAVRTGQAVEARPSALATRRSIMTTESRSPRAHGQGERPMRRDIS